MHAKIACITYTNAAVREIQERIDNDRLTVSTIHDFLWDNISPYQKEMKAVLVDLLNAPEPLIKMSDVVDAAYFEEKKIQYKEYLLIREGIISHDELLIVAEAMFSQYPKLNDIMKDKYRYVFIDEYQDTNPRVVRIFLESLKKSARITTVGFFGDSMQSIYDDGIGSLEYYIATGDIKEVKKAQNRRNPRLVYKLANRLRTDGLIQEASKDLSAPNMSGGVVKEGVVRFLYSYGDTDELDKAKSELDWDFTDVHETKELDLTHNLIAPRAGFEHLIQIYDGDKIIDYRNRVTKYIKDKGIDKNYSGMTFGQVVDELLAGKTAKEQKPILPTAGMQAFISQNPALFEEAKGYPFDEFRKLYIDKDMLLDDKKQDDLEQTDKETQRDNLIKHMFKIQTLIALYEERRFNEFVRKTEYKISSVADKNRIKGYIDKLKSMSDCIVEDVINYAHETGLCICDDKLSEFIENKRYLYNRVAKVRFEEFQKLYTYLEGRTVFSTQHKIKGAQYDRVLVVLDNGNWSKYSFQYLFEGTGTESVILRTQKLFYVCCTRAKENLAVYYHNPTETVLRKAKEWFGNDNVVLVT
jgi:DNA helicase-2/ATP-dependent DNA helicase PcrA